FAPALVMGAIGEIAVKTLFGSASTFIVGVVACSVVAGVLAAPFFSIFVIPPLEGLAPKGLTLVVPRLDKMQFIDSIDGLCARNGGVTPVCRLTVLAALGAEIKNKKHSALHLPYSQTLYKISTNGKLYR